MMNNIENFINSNDRLLNFDDDINRSIISFCEKNKWENIWIEGASLSDSAAYIINISKNLLEKRILPRIPENDHRKYNNELWILTIAEMLCNNRNLDKTFFERFLIKKYSKDIIISSDRQIDSEKWLNWKSKNIILHIKEKFLSSLL